LFATIELGGSIVTSVVAVLVPWLVIFVLSAFMLFVCKKMLRKSREPVPG
jgi:hypothetical protein